MKRMSVIRIMCLFLVLAGIAVPCLAAGGPLQAQSYLFQVTRDSHYDRNPSLMQARDGTYWLVFTRGRDPLGIRGLNGYDPDVDYYDIYYRTAKTIPGLLIAQERKVPGTYPDNAQRDVAALQAGDGTIRVFASTGLGMGGERSVYYYTFKAGAWSGPVAVPGTDYAAHVDAVEKDGKLWVFYDRGYELFVTSYSLKTGVWSSPVSIHTEATIAKALLDNGKFFAVWVPSSGAGVYLSTSPDGITWTSTTAPIAQWPGPGITNWDPVLARDGKVFRLFWAPSNAEQFLATTSSPDPMKPASWSPPVRLTTAMSGSNGWWDFWPEPVLRGRWAMGSPAIVFTSERNREGTARIDGNIWLYVATGRCF